MNRLPKDCEKFYAKISWRSDLVSGFEAIIKPESSIEILETIENRVGLINDRACIYRYFKTVGSYMKNAMEKIDSEIEKEREKQFELELNE